MRRKVLVWPAIALAMYASRRRDLRRAALRGLLAASVARVLLSVPPWRGGYIDEATTGGFVAGAGIELPLSAPPLAVLGATLERETPDVGRAALAAAVGAASAAVTTRVWPVAPRTGTAPKAWLSQRAEPNPDGAGVTIVVNADSGPAGAETPTDALRQGLSQAEVVEVEIEDGDELRKVLDDAAERGAVALGVSGGDGSINTAAQVAIEANKALMVVPSGTFNHLTGALGIASVEDSIEAVKAGQAVAMDVATVGGHVFLNTASFGSYVELVDAREKLEKRIGKWPAVVVALVRVLRHSEPIEVEIEGEPQSVWMAFIGNCRYHPSGFAPTWRERLDDGLLDFRYVSGNQPYARTRLILAVMTGRLGRSKVYRQTCVERLTLRSLSGTLRLARDGETFEASDDVVVEKLDERLAVYVPHSRNRDARDV